MDVERNAQVMVGEREKEREGWCVTAAAEGWWAEAGEMDCDIGF